MSTLGITLLVVLIVALVASVPGFSYSRSWGYGPSGVVGLILIVLIVLLITGRL